MTPLLATLARRFPDAAASYRELRDMWRFLKAPSALSSFGCRMAGNEGMVTGGYEQEELELVKELVVGADVFIDVGANIGLYSCLARSLSIRVVAVEAMPSNLRYLLRNLEENGFGDVEVIAAAVAATPGISRMYASGVGASLVSGWAGTDENFSTRVPVTTLDALLADRLAGQRAVIKMDIEGAEETALQGASRLLRNEPQPVWIVENTFGEHSPDGKNPSFRRVFEHFWKNGYEVKSADSDRIDINEDSVDGWMANCGHPPGRNFLFTPTVNRASHSGPVSPSIVS